MHRKSGLWLAAGPAAILFGLIGACEGDEISVSENDASSSGTAMVSTGSDTATCVSDTECDDSNECTTDTCAATTGRCAHEFSHGSTCRISTNADGHCVRDKERCVNCLDPDEDGDTSDATCGNGCPACLENGGACEANGQCVSAYCSNGTCCDSNCRSLCVTCNRSGNCVNVVQYKTDVDPNKDESCNGVNVCDGEGACKLNIGEQCHDDNARCASTLCDKNQHHVSDSVCLVPAGKPCTSDDECTSFCKGKCRENTNITCDATTTICTCENMECTGQ